MESEEHCVENNEEYILSLTWDSGHLAAVYYNLSTLELHIVQDVADHRPDYVYLRSLFRQVEPQFLIACGPNNFLQDLLELLNIDAEAGIEYFMIKKTKSSNANSSNLTFYTFDRKNSSKIDEMRKKIYSLDLPGLPAESSKNDRQIFMESALPMKQELFIISLGNLLRYLAENHMKWRHVFLSLDVNPIISNVLLSLLESQVLLDDMTFNSLNIFTNIYHPSSFKIQIRKDGLSLYNMLNQCCSSNGSQELKKILQQPTHNVDEIKMRLSTIEWCLKSENSDHVQRFKQLLSGFINLNASLQRILINHGKTNDWKSFKRTIYHAFSICEMCASFSEESIHGTILAKLAAYCKRDQTINGVLFALDKVVDLEKVDEKKRFYVKPGIDLLLDRKIDALNDITENFNNFEPDATLISLNDSINSFQFVYYGEMGFAIGTLLRPEQLNLSLMAESGIELILQTDTTLYFRTPNCVKLNQEYEEKFAEVIEHEMKIFNKLITYVHANFAEIAEIAKFCAKLDCLIAFATVSAKNKFSKPLVTEKRIIEIVNGRHPLVEQIRDFVPSTTIINDDNKSYINIIRAPNSSGKSVYVKQVALIVYMAHIGCFVPCDSCNISLMHSIYTRIYTPESISNNESAFMSDIQQMSKVVMNSTPRSLVLIDEFGKGTHYKDGISLLTATIEHFIERGSQITPFVFVTTHYPQVYDLLKTKELTSLKTISTTKNDSNIFQSTFKIVEGSNDQVCTEYPESHSIISNIFKQKDRDEELKTLNDSYNTSIKSFVLMMARMKLRSGNITQGFLNDMYSKVDIENFLAFPEQ